MQHILNRFLKYVSFDTQSNPENPAFPSTEKQWVLANYLKEELLSIGVKDVSICDQCYVYASIPANTDKNIPAIGFVSHMDTSPDFTGTNVKPQIHQNYDGTDIILNKKDNIVLSSSYFPELKQYIGQTIITTDGTTLLGADDKAGITAIVSAVEDLLKSEIEHGRISICFTPDEEVGKGAHQFDLKKFNADWAYTIDGGEIGELEYENFNAAAAQLKITGKIVHPGYAKNKMINALLIAHEFMAMLPENEIPQETEGYQGFYHLHDLHGDVETCTLQYIIRDHNKNEFELRKEKFQKAIEQLEEKYSEVLFESNIKDQYYNMEEILKDHLHIVKIAETSMKAVGVKPNIKPIRGGTDGSQLSFMGLPCPNIFAGGHNFHGKYEYVPLESIVKAKEVILKIIEQTYLRYR